MIDCFTNTHLLPWPSTLATNGGHARAQPAAIMCGSQWSAPPTSRNGHFPRMSDRHEDSCSCPHIPQQLLGGPCPCVPSSPGSQPLTCNPIPILMAVAMRVTTLHNTIRLLWRPMTGLTHLLFMRNGIQDGPYTQIQKHMYMMYHL